MTLTYIRYNSCVEAFPGSISSNEPTCQCRRHKRDRFDSWVGKIPGGGHGNPLQYFCLENPMDRGAWRATAHGVAKSQTQLSTHASVGTVVKLSGEQEGPQRICCFSSSSFLPSLSFESSSRKARSYFLPVHPRFL